MKILVIDAQGGGLGKQIISMIRSHFRSVEITAVGTNSLATSNMLKAGANHGATGENAVVVGCRRSDIIIGPIGIAIADSMYGEITERMAVAVGQSDARKFFMPMSHCNNQVIGTGNLSIGEMLNILLDELSKILE